jgi:hypothetical protein
MSLLQNRQLTRALCSKDAILAEETLDEDFPKKKIAVSKADNAAFMDDTSLS